uniref:Sperm acrosome associated 7 n=1 Tax=Nannospalax galili TaxID=1026970 RepID=A0A8C6RKN6_NANGA
MAANRGMRTFFSVFLLCCWQGMELQPTKGTSGPVTEDSLNATTDGIPEVFDEILAQEILEPKKSAVSETTKTTKPSTTTKQTKEKNSSVDETYQENGSKNYHELLDNSELSSLNKEKFGNNDRITADTIHTHGPENKLEPHFSSEDKKDSNNDKYSTLSVLDKILQNIGRTERNLELKENIF